MYKQIEILNKEKSKSLKVDEIVGFEFCSDLTNSPISISEFREASKYFPIVFIKNNDEYSAVVVLGLDKNEFVKDNKWEENTYIPAYIRRYPFIFVKGQKDLFLAIDKSCKAVNKRKGKSLFTRDGENSEYLNSVIKFLEDYQKDITLTSSIIRQFDELGLLEDASLSKDNAPILKGFKKINEKKLLELDDAKLSAMVRNGVYRAIVYHLDSLENFAKVVK